jgi:hypothetical protein
MPELLWCALSGLLAGALVSAPVWWWVVGRDRRRLQEFQRLAREAWRRLEDDA